MSFRSPICLLAILTASIRPALAAPGARLLEVLPDDALGAVVIERPAKAFSALLAGDLATTLTGSMENAARLREAVQRLPGGVLIGLTRPAASQPAPGLIIAFERGDKSWPYDDYLEKTLLPAVHALAGGNLGKLNVERFEGGVRIFQEGATSPGFEFAANDKIVFGSSLPKNVARWRRGDWPKKRWIDGPGVRSMIARLPKSPSIRAFLNPKSLSGLPGKPEPATLDAMLMQVLSPDDLRAASVDLNLRRDGVDLSLSIATIDEPKGVSRILVGAGAPTGMLGVFGEEWPCIGRISFNSARSVVNSIYSLTDRFDDSIGSEYREELADFQKETGVDLEHDLLASIGSEATFGVRFDFLHRPPIAWGVVLPVMDAAKLADAIAKLESHFGLTFDDDERDGIRVRTATGTRPFAMAIHGGTWIVASGGETVAELAKRTAAGVGGLAPANENIRRAYKSISPTNRMAFLIDLKQLCKSVPVLPMLIGPKLAPLLSDGSVAAWLSGDEHIGTLNFRWELAGISRSDRKPRATEGAAPEAATGGDGFVVLAGVLAESIVQAREQARRVVSASNLRTLGQGVMIYANDHKGEFPAGLEELFKINAATLSQFVSPYDGSGPRTLDEIAAKSYIIYRPGLTSNSDASEVLMAEGQIHSGKGANFLFVDGHVEFIAEPKASELIQTIRDAASAAH